MSVAIFGLEQNLFLYVDDMSFFLMQPLASQQQPVKSIFKIKILLKSTRNNLTRTLNYRTRCYEKRLQN